MDVAPAPVAGRGDTATVPRSRRPRIWLGVAGPGLVAGAIAAVVGLDRAALWRDEAYSLGAVHQLGTTLEETGRTMGLYYVLLRGWVTVSDSAVWLRALSVVLALAALALFALLAIRLVGAAAARLATLFLGLSVLWVNYAQEARAYALVMLLVVGSWHAFDRGLADGDGARRWWYLHRALAVALPFAHGLAVLQLVAQPVACALGRADRRVWRRLLPGTAAGLLVTGALAATGGSEVGTWIAPTDPGLVGHLVQAFTSFTPAGTLLLLATAAVGLAAARSGRRAAPTGADRVRAAIPASWALVAPVLLLALSTVRPSLLPRYVVASAPGVALLLAVACADLARRGRGTGGRVVTALVLAVLLAGQIQLHRETGDDWRAAARTVAAAARPHDHLLLAQAEMRPPFEAAWREVPHPVPLPLVNGPRPLGRVLRIDDHVPDSELVERARSLGRLWLVGETRSIHRRLIRDALTDRRAGPGTHVRAGSWNEPGGVTVDLLVPR